MITFSTSAEFSLFDQVSVGTLNLHQKQAFVIPGPQSLIIMGMSLSHMYNQLATTHLKMVISLAISTTIFAATIPFYFLEFSLMPQKIQPQSSPSPRLKKESLVEKLP